MAVKPGYKQTEVGVIPEEWEVVAVERLVEEKALAKPLDGNHGNIHPKSSDYVYYGIPFVMANNFSNGHVNFENCKFITKERADKLQKGFSVSGDVLLTHKGTVGSTAIVGELSTEYIMLTPQVTYYRVTDANSLNNCFLRHYFDSPPFQSLFISLAGGGTRAYLGIVKQLALPIVKPPIEEQRAIAAALSDVDALLDALEQLIAKKRDLKQATMQQLLTGQTRLPGFEAEWGMKRLGDILTVKHGKSQHGITAPAGEYPILASGGEIGRTNSFIYDKPSVLIGRKGTIDSPQYVDSPFWTVDTLFYSEISSEADAKFVFYKFAMIRWRSYNEASGVPSLNAKTIENIEIKTPLLPEQTAIASMLTDMDAELAALEQRLAKTRALKQGMMQELLTGRTRLL